MYEDNDEARFLAETQEEAHYWWTVSDFAQLSLKHPMDKVLKDMLQLRDKAVIDNAIRRYDENQLIKDL